MKNIKYLLVLLVMSIFFVSCEKQSQENEWKHLKGYTVDDIAGTYAFSNITDAFDGLTPGTGCHICKDAQITITATSGNIVEINVNCPNDNFSHSFGGRPRMNDDDYLIKFGATPSNNHPTYGLLAYVYENEQGDIRLSGHAEYIEWKIIINSEGEQEYKFKSKTSYYFDVIKN